MAAALFVYLLSFLLVGAFAAPQEDPASIDNLENGYFFSNTRIVGGEQAGDNEMPHMAALTTGTLVTSFMCGASIIAPNCLLTAAHCIEAMHSCGLITGCSIVNSARGSVGSNQWRRGGTSYPFSGNATHPNYIGSRIKNDIGLLFTSTNMVFTERVQPVPLNFEYIGGGTPVVVSGWGRVVAGGSLSADLKKVHKNVLDGAECVDLVARHALENNIASPGVEPHLEICTFHSRGQGTCNGDSGSALITEDKRQQVGIVSWGFPCALGAPDVYARVSGFEDWLQTVMPQ